VNIDNLWPPNWHQIWADVLAGQPWVLATAGAIAALILAIVTTMVIRSLRGKTFDAKASIGFAAVQTGVAYITITGTYGFFNRLLHMPAPESGLLAGFIEACVWAAVGMIYVHGRGFAAAEKPNTGFGAAGGFFWTTVGGGGLLAVLGSESLAIAIGRIVIVVLGAYMWYLRLLSKTRRSGKRSRFRWTPKALLMLIGALVPEDGDVQDEGREWQIRRCARAIRWSNSDYQPWKWLGKRGVTKASEQYQPDTIVEAMRRYARGTLLRSHVAEDSEMMQSVIAEIRHTMCADTTAASALPSATASAIALPASAAPAQTPTRTVSRSPADAPSSSMADAYADPADASAGRPSPSGRRVAAATQTRTRAASRRADQPGADNARASAETRKATAFTQYAAAIARGEDEPSGTVVGEWMGVGDGRGRTVRNDEFRLRLASEVASGERACPHPLPAGILTAATASGIELPPEVAVDADAPRRRRETDADARAQTPTSGGQAGHSTTDGGLDNIRSLPHRADRGELAAAAN
jgi:hypothetical protein